MLTRENAVRWVPEKKQSELLAALRHVRQLAVVVTGPPGCGKTSAIREASRALGYELEEIEAIKDYTRRRFTDNIIFLLEVEDFERAVLSEAPYPGLVIETHNKYLYRHIPGSIPITFNKVPQRQLDPAFRCHLRMGGNLHHALALSSICPRARDILQEGLLPEAPNFFHIIGKILYCQGSLSEDALQLIEQQDRGKVVMYIHENICDFIIDVKDLSETLWKISEYFACLSRASFVSLVLHVASAKKVKPSGFHAIRSPRRQEREKGALMEKGRKREGDSSRQSRILKSPV